MNKSLVKFGSLFMSALMMVGGSVSCMKENDKGKEEGNTNNIIIDKLIEDKNTNKDDNSKGNNLLKIGNTNSVKLVNQDPDKIKSDIAILKLNMIQDFENVKQSLKETDNKMEQKFKSINDKMDALNKPSKWLYATIIASIIAVAEGIYIFCDKMFKSDDGKNVSKKSKKISKKEARATV